jgi:hypothetical protein
VERATGIEPAWPAWKAGTLPLSYARVWSGKVPLARVTAKRFLPSESHLGSFAISALEV